MWLIGQQPATLPRHRPRWHRMAKNDTTIYWSSMAHLSELEASFVMMSYINWHIYIPTWMPLTGATSKGGIWKKLLFSTSVSLHRMLPTVRPSGVINGVPPECGKLVTLIAGVCIQHSSEVCITVLLWPFVAGQCYAIET